MAISHITTYVDDGLALLLQQYKGKPRMTALLTTYLEKLQAIEDVAWQLFLARCLQNSPTGDLLVKIGELVGQANITGNEDDFRLFIRARVAVRQSSGRRGALVKVTRALWQSSSAPTVLVLDMPPACVIVNPLAAVASSPAVQVSSFLGPAVGAAINLQYIWFSTASSGIIYCASVHETAWSSGPPPSSALGTTQIPGSTHHAGFASGPPPSSAGGGVLAGVIAW